jgi:type II secretory pathway pseudopilin PulG
MRGENYRGAFTIIEVMLVLAITGLLFVGLIGSFQSTISKQRYNDSVVTFENALQEQYDLVSSVQNGRDLTQRVNCVKSGDGKSVTSTDNGTYAPGMSKCLIYGRLIEIRDDGREVASSNVIGLDPSDNGIDLSKITEIDAFKQVIMSKEKINGNVNPDTTQMPWTAQLYNPSSPASQYNDGAIASGGLLILKSPVSGTIWTYRFKNAVSGTALSDLIVGDNVASRSFCVRSDDAAQQSRRAVIAGGSGVLAGANSSAVQLAPLDVEVNGVKPVDCNDKI